MAATAFISITSHTSPAELVRMMSPLVRRIALRMARGVPSHVRTDDLMSAGMVGLLEATKRFEPARAESFVGYAALRIRGAILDELRRGDIMSQEARMKARQIQALVQKLESELNRAPEPKEIADALGVSEQAYREELQALTSVKLVSFDPQDEGSALEDIDCPSPMDTSAFREERDRLAHAIAALPEKERLILSLYYDEELTYKEIGKVLDLTAARICQLHAQAVARLKDQLAEKQVA